MQNQTKLCDGGFMETDDPVVAVCFLERYVSSPRYLGETVLLAVNRLQVQLQYSGEQSGWFLYPIRIPAATVAEVWRGGNAVATGALACSTGDSIDEWLRQHTKEAK